MFLSPSPPTSDAPAHLQSLIRFIAGLAIVCVCLFSSSAFAATADELALQREVAAFDPADQAQSFAAAEDFLDQHKRLMELEQQALQLVADEPLKLGALGAAILDIYPASHTGHYVLKAFYSHLEERQALQRHTALLERLQNHMQSNGNGRQSSPYPIMTVYDAHTFARTKSQTPVGFIYQHSDATTFGYLLAAQPSDGALTYYSFDLAVLFDRYKESTEDDKENGPWGLIRQLATNLDSAAQTAIGAYLARFEQYEQAIGWLRVGSRTGNVLANSLLARIYHTQSNSEEDPDKQAELKDQALDHHMQAIALGSTESMYTLANLYLNDYYGEENRGAGIPLLQQAGELGHTEALIYLGHLFSMGTEVTQNLEQAQQYFEAGAANDDPEAILSYGRFVFSSREAPPNQHLLMGWLEKLARDDNAEAMIILGNLFARGIGVKATPRKAVSWYKKAVKAAPRDADVVNEVAWTLTVSDVEGLTRFKYARRIMDRLMKSDDAARARPEYLDTWAAIYAAVGKMDRAVELQQRAVEAAKDQQRSDVMDILNQHLEAFKAGESITEPAP